MERFGVIYRITNKVNGKCYIGQTVEKNPMRRINRHFQKTGKKHPLRNSIKHHGRENFEIEILLTAFDLETLNVMEIEFIEKHNSCCPSGYNLKLGGEQGGKLSQETKDKLREKSLEWYSKNDAYFKGKKFTKEHCENLSKVRKGFTSEARMKAAKINGERTAMPVKAIHIKTGREHTFKSLDECAKELGLQGSNISRVLNKRQNRTQHKGYKFERIKDDK